jgi:ATP-dependent helicase/nuclease subunit A
MSQGTVFVSDENQSRASDPEASAWVSANAGTGKTAVLVRRVLRLLLAGAAPEGILCLTYTKNAAAEMENRLLKELARWAINPEEELRGDINALTGKAPGPSLIDAARRLFARTLEAKGGLKIYTIHGFCERVLQRFPLEAGIAPNFSVLDGRDATLLRTHAFDATIARIAAHSNGPLGKALLTVLGRSAESQLRILVDLALEQRAMLGDLRGRGADWPEAECRTLKRVLGVEHEQEQALIGTMASVVDDSLIDQLLHVLSENAAADADQALKVALETARGAAGESRIAALRPVFCTAENKPRARLGSKAMVATAPKLMEALKAAQTEYCAAELKLDHLRAAESSVALLVLANEIHAEYERRKRTEAALDYDDLIAKTVSLFVDAGAAPWVLYKMDRGIDHILVDEAQDTNPKQWAIVRALAEEFFAGQGGSEQLRTLFAVGDEKQSIYSFQGADPARFDAAGRDFHSKAIAARLAFHRVPLTLSFRSTEPILNSVDAVFAQETAAEGLTWGEATITHSAFRKSAPGLVEVWDVEKEQEAPDVHAFEPWKDQDGSVRAVERLCQRIAATIKAWLNGAQGGVLESERRRVKPGDILILVRRRDPFTTPMIRALKRTGIPVAGADRMLLMQQLVVQDLVALADFLLMPEDDLSLAVVLKSPLFGLDDDALFAIAPGRQHSLWAALQASDDPRFAEAATRLGDWLSQTDLTPPYEFFAELLGADGGLMRTRLLTRLGPEAAEAIEEFLGLALAYDREAAPSLQGFIAQLRAGDLEVKRDMEQDRDEIRIMTVHGAKGLQAPIVFLPDTCQTPRSPGARLYELPRHGGRDEFGHLIWPVAKRKHDAIDAAKDAVREAEFQEYHRLLYVAMTRAQDRLYVCGWQGKTKLPEGCWYELIKTGLAKLLSPVEGLNGVWRVEKRPTEPVQSVETAKAEDAAIELPAWALTPAPLERSPFELRPSRLAVGQTESSSIEDEQVPLGPAALADNARFTRGRLVHALLQHLPELGVENRERAARAFVAARGADLAEAVRSEIVTETLAITNDAAFAPLFAEGSLAEVPVVAVLREEPEAAALSGQIDRLAVLGDELLILDYKTNRPPPSRPEDVAPAYVAQLAAYRFALRRMFPDKPVRAALLWTDGPKLMEIPSNMLDDAECRMVQPEAKP